MAAGVEWTSPQQRASGGRLPRRVRCAACSDIRSAVEIVKYGLVSFMRPDSEGLPVVWVDSRKCVTRFRLLSIFIERQIKVHAVRQRRLGSLGGLDVLLQTSIASQASDFRL